MKHKVFICLLMTIAFGAQAQFKISDDIVGTPLGTKPPKTFVGSEYLYDKFVKGHVLQADSVYFNNMEINYDVMSDRVLFLRGGQEMAFKHPIKEFQIIKPKIEPIYIEVFRNGFPPIGDNTEKSYYMVLNNGKTVALKKPMKSISEVTPYGSAKVQKTVINSEHYFIFHNGQMIKIKKDKKSLLNALEDKKELLGKYMSDNNINIKTDEDIRVVLDYYNSLSTS